jgi:hypothetical protein
MVEYKLKISTCTVKEIITIHQFIYFISKFITSYLIHKETKSQNKNPVSCLFHAPILHTDIASLRLHL